MGKQLVSFTVILIVFFTFVCAFDCVAFESCAAHDSAKSYFDESYLLRYADDLRKEDFQKIEEETKDAFIENFDVSEDGKALICLENDTVNVYDVDGGYEFTLKYDANGSSSMAFWYKDNIVIYI